MDIYYAMTSYHVLCCLLHKMTSNKKSKAKIWVSSYLVDDYPSIIDDLKGSLVFDEVERFEEARLIHYGQKKTSRKIVNEEINNICDVMKRHLPEIRQSDYIYVCQDAYGLGIFLNKMGIHYYYFEDGCGRLSNPEIEIELIREDYPIREIMVKELGCLGVSMNVEKRFGDLSEQRKGYHDSRDVDFSVKRILKSMSDEELDVILKIYHCKRVDLGRMKKDILLTWHYYNMGFMTLEEQRKFFTLLVDYFRDESEALFIKPHPSDKQPDYQKWFSDAVVIERHMPSELLPYLVNGKFEKGITNWSTSVYGLQGIINEIINFDKGIDIAYRDINKIFAIVKYLDSIKNGKMLQKIKLIDVDYSLFCQMMKYYVKDYKKYYQVVEEDEDFSIVKRYCDDYYGKKCIALEKGDSYAFSGFLRIILGSDRQDVFLYKMPCGNVNLKKKLYYCNEYLYVSSFDLENYISLLEADSLKKKEIEKELREKREENNQLSGIINDCKEQNVALRKEIEGMVDSYSWKMTAVLRALNFKRKKHGFRKNKKNS